VQPTIAIAVTTGVVLLATVVGLVWRARTGRMRTAVADRSFPAGSLPGLDALASGATLVQFSTEYCAQCPATRRLLSGVARERGGVAFLDVDLTRDPDLARRLGILQTPTVFILDGAGRLVGRVGGTPRRTELVGVLDTLAPLPEWSL
jgi:thiol-disulfide isomerase/thioredoxin